MKKIIRISVRIILFFVIITAINSCTKSKDATPPSVTTVAITDITQTGAVSGGNVTNDNGSEISSRGVCWGITANPTITDSHTSDGTGKGVFTSNINGLEVGTLYHVRSYATNSAGTTYGNEVTFTTSGSVATLLTTAVSAITSTTAISGGDITDDNGNDITARGVCWGIAASPDITGSHSTDGTDTGNFTSDITGLTAGTLYYVRAYATNVSGTAYGNEISFTTLP